MDAVTCFDLLCSLPVSCRFPPPGLPMTDDDWLQMDDAAALSRVHPARRHQNLGLAVRRREAFQLPHRGLLRHDDVSMKLSNLLHLVTSNMSASFGESSGPLNSTIMLLFLPKILTDKVETVVT